MSVSQYNSSESPQDEYNKENTQMNDGANGGSSTGNLRIPILSEDYAELGLLPEVDEEGDYSTPTARNYELTRSQITLNEIIGIGQFGDVNIGTCRIPRSNIPNKKTVTDIGEDVIVPVAIKTCKPDADLKTSEKFLEEACKSLYLCSSRNKIPIIFLSF
jgi:focal adhesion kinase 1